MKIYAPVKDFNGLRNNVRFVNGVGETDDAVIIAWFKIHGYSVEECKSPRVEQAATVQPKVVAEDVGIVNQPDFEAMTPNELRDWMREHGYGSRIKNTRNKEKLLEILRG